MAVLEVEDIHAHYGLFHALKGVSLEVASGDVLAIVGANGAGKSTLLRAICGALPVTGGKVAMNGSSIQNQPAYELNALGIALVPEGRRIFPSLSVEDNLVLGGYRGRKGHWTLQRVYELFPELVKRRHNAGLDLSGGEQQMVAIGRALMSNPELILMDEISLGLAPIVVEQIYRAMGDITAQGATVLLVEQDLSRAFTVAQHVCFLLEGRVSLRGVPSALGDQEMMTAYFGASV
ncbi:MAG: transporter ATP-binding protein [Devosia sp.]|uniref:ABC transporter ATP-binding protein n=1 Tax=Devosia sp. TaxID=1871048 RepID=UPI0026090877|nr:ABC transporter ATP-binding protein [Devosia sp.]MDB5526990.1 transporter ATP-binding protein [Devosia sp.]